MNPAPPLLLRLTVSALPFASVLAAQTRPASTTGPDESKVVQLDEFQVTSERDTTFRATHATAGTRLGTKIKDLPQSITVLTEDFLQDNDV